jgi:hypothetical protein
MVRYHFEQIRIEISLKQSKKSGTTMVFTWVRPIALSISFPLVANQRNKPFHTETFKHRFPNIFNQVEYCSSLEIGIKELE